MTREAVRTLLVLSSLSALASLGATSAALAHAHLQAETPAANSKGASPQQLRLKFSEALELKFTTVKVTGPDGKAAATGSPTLDPADDTSLIVPVTVMLPAGKYKVDWHATATDTHKTQGVYTFTVIP